MREPDRGMLMGMEVERRWAVGEESESSAVGERD